MKLFILFTAVIEIVAGVVFFIYPGLIPDFQGADALAVTLARMYGAAALTVGYYAFMVWKHMNPGAVLGFLKTFFSLSYRCCGSDLLWL